MSNFNICVFTKKKENQKRKVKNILPRNLLPSNLNRTDVKEDVFS